MQSGISFYYPAISMNEVHKYRELIIEKSGLSSDEYTELLRAILSYITLIRNNNLVNYLEEGNRIIGKIDKKDIAFISCALAVDADGIWSEDRHFEEQNKIRVLKTKEMLTLYSNNL